MVIVVKKCVAVFKSRTQVMAFKEIMNSRGVSCKLISTPKEAHVGCGVSAEFSQNNLNLAKTVVGRGKFSSFVGFFLIEKRGSHTTTARI
jgi:hypothetical protein